MPTKWVSRTPWRQKLEKLQAPKIVPVPAKWQKRFGTGTMLIPNPMQVDALIRLIPPGKLATSDALRERLARDHGADHTCPLVTGIFLRIAAETAEEDKRTGRSEITPYWRVITGDGSLRQRFPGGPAAQARMLRAEGHTILAAKGRGLPKVKDFEQKLVKFERAAAVKA